MRRGAWRGGTDSVVEGKFLVKGWLLAAGGGTLRQKRAMRSTLTMTRTQLATCLPLNNFVLFGAPFSAELEPRSSAYQQPPSPPRFDLIGREGRAENRTTTGVPPSFPRFAFLACLGFGSWTCWRSENLWG